MRRICFVTCRRWPEISESDRLAQGALEARGATVHPRPWNDPAAAHATLAALPRPSLYARIDGVETREGFLIMEVEVNEPGLFLTLAPVGGRALRCRAYRQPRAVRRLTRLACISST